MQSFAISRATLNIVGIIRSRPTQNRRRSLRLALRGPEGLCTHAPAEGGGIRIIFALEADVIQVRLIGKRNDDEIYKVLERAWRK